MKQSGTDKSIWRLLEFYLTGRRFGPTVLDRYIFWEIVQPLAVALLFLTSLFVSVVLKDVAGELIGKGISVLKMLEYLKYLVSEKLTQTIPFACLLAGILAAGRLSGDSEINAMRSAGISFPRIYLVFLFVGVLTAVLVAWMNLYYGPINSRAREDFEDWLKSYHSLTLVKSGRFLGRAKPDGLSKKGQDIYSENRVGNVLHEVQIREWYNWLDEGNSEIITLRDTAIPIGDGFITQVVHAKTGELLTRINAAGKPENIIRLKNGFLIELDEKQSHYQVTNFFDGSMDYRLPAPVKPLGRLNVKPDNYTYLELFDFLEKLEKGGARINLAELMGQGGYGALSSTVDFGHITNNAEDEDPNILKLPAFSEMQAMSMKLWLWIGENANKVGKEGGPNAQEFQQKQQMALQLRIFLQDAEKTRRRFEVEIHKRLSTPVACLLFFFISFPLGLVVKRSGRGMSFSLALFVFAVYYFFLSVGLARAYKGSLSPAVGAWLPDVVVALLGIYIMLSRTAGFAPFRFLKELPLGGWVDRLRDRVLMRK